MRKKNIIINLKLFLLILLASFLFCLQNPNFINKEGFGFIAWISYVPVLWVIYKSSFKQSACFGILYGIFSYLFYSYWLYSYDKMNLYGILFLYAMFGCVLFLLLKYSEKIYKQHFNFIQLLIINCYEILKAKGFLGFSYGITAYSQWKYLPIIQICDVIGIYGLNFLIISFSCIIVNILIKCDKKSKLKYYNNEQLAKISLDSHVQYVSEFKKEIKKLSLKPNFILLILFSLVFTSICIYGNKKIKNYKIENTINIAAIQNNEDPYKDEYKENIQNLISLTENAFEINNKIDVIIWPETSVTPPIVYNYTEKVDSERYMLVSSILNFINKHNSIFIIGNGHKTENSLTNSALIFKSKENVFPPEPLIYSKNHLVPFSEKLPNLKNLPHIDGWLHKNKKNLFNQGTELTTFNLDGINFSTPICFEDTFPELCRNMYKNGSRCFLVLSSDAWAKSEVSQYQHLSLCIFRSIENGIPMVRSSTTGQTCIINSLGQIEQMCLPFCKSFVIGQIENVDILNKGTVYVNYGYYFEYILLFFTLLLLIIQIFIVIIRDKGITDGRK